MGINKVSILYFGPYNAASTRMCVREHCKAADYL